MSEREPSVSAETVPQTARGFPRASAAIPVRVEIAHTWERTTRRSIPGTLVNVSQGGGGVSMAWAVPPSTRVIVLVPTGSKLRLLAEIVWTSATPGGDPGSAMYGLRWVEHLPEKYLDLMTAIPDQSASIQRDPAGSRGTA
jgi:hypothetical protein